MNSLKEKNLLKSYWRAKQALHWEADRKLGIAVRARMLYIYNMCCTFITWRVHERFYRLDLKKKIWSSWITLHRYARFVNDEETAASLKAKGKKPYIHNPDSAWTIYELDLKKKMK